MAASLPAFAASNINNTNSIYLPDPNGSINAVRMLNLTYIIYVAGKYDVFV